MSDKNRENNSDPLDETADFSSSEDHLSRTLRRTEQRLTDLESNAQNPQQYFPNLRGAETCPRAPFLFESSPTADENLGARPKQTVQASIYETFNTPDQAKVGNPSPDPTSSRVAAGEDEFYEIQEKFSIVRQSVDKIILPPRMKLHDTRTGIKQTDQRVVNVLAKNGRYTETLLKLLSCAKNDQPLDLNPVVTVLLAQIQYLQEEFAACLVKGKFDDNMADLFHASQKVMDAEIDPLSGEQPPESLDTLCYKLGKCEEKKGEFESAVRCYRKALFYNAEHKEADASLKECLKTLRTEQFHNLVKEKLLNMGKMTFEVALQQSEKIAYDFTREYNSKSAKAVMKEYTSLATDAFMKAVECRICGKYERAKVLYEILIDLDPGYPNTLMTQVHMNQYTCSWNETMTKHLMELTELQLLYGETPLVTPHQASTYLPFPGKLCLEVAKKYAADVQSHCMTMPQRGPTMEVEEDCSKTRFFLNFPVPETERHKVLKPRIRLGYVSSDFKDHSLSHLIEGIFSCHNRSEFKVYCYALKGDDGSEFRKRIKKDADVFRDISSEDLQTIKNTIQADEIDILINLNGYTMDSRNEIFALRPAPIQVMWLGFPGTSGSKYMDYIFTDEVTTPSAQTFRLFY